MDTLTKFGKKIREIRRLRDFTQAELAEMCNLSNNFIALLERGRNAPSIGTLEKLADALNVSISELFEFERETGKIDEREKAIQKLTRVRNTKDFKLIGDIADLIWKSRK